MDAALVNGKMIRAARRRFGWSQGELAIKAGVSQSIVSRLEAERAPYDCKLSNVIALSSTLLIPLDSLLKVDTQEEELADCDLEPTLSAVVKILSKADYYYQHQAALILDGYLTSLLYDEDDLKFSDVSVDVNSLDE